MPRMKLQPQIWNSTKLLAKAGIINNNRPIPQTGAGIPSSTISLSGAVLGRTWAMSVLGPEKALRTERKDGSHD